MSTLGKSKIKILTATTKIWYVTPKKYILCPPKGYQKHILNKIFRY